MNDMKRIATGASLLERAAEVYDFQAALRARHGEPAPVQEAMAEAEVAEPAAPRIAHVPPVIHPATASQVISRDLLAEQGLLVPGAPVGTLAEQFRQIKRQLLLTARTVKTAHADKARTILVCSASPDEGKTFCSINLALSIAAERDTEVVLVDADFAKPDILGRLGLATGPGLLDALADPAVDVEACVMRTDIPQFSILPAGTKSHHDTELLASDRTPALLKQLLDADPRRLLIFDSPPALAASPAATLALHVGQVLLVVRADRTSDADLREAVALLDGCEHIQLALNAVSYAPGGRRFGNYYGQEELA